jgi:ABC-type branched-subunit amino acid transport system ATPase component
MFGGVGTVWGPVIGAVILIPLAEILNAEAGTRFPGIQGVIFGLAIVCVILIAPEGLFWKVRDLLRKRRPVPGPESGNMEAANIGAVAAPSGIVMSPARTDPPQEIILEVRGLSRSFGGLKAVQNVSLELRKNAILGIIGPNGAGKTTLFNLLNGFLRPDAGEVLIDGRNMIGCKPHELCEAGIGRTFQIMRPFQRMSISDNVVIGAYIRAKTDTEARKLAAGAIARVGLSGMAHRMAGELSTKELRLMELARALASQPRILLLDETLAGLGHDEANEVVAVIQRLATEDVTIAIIEHTMQSMVRLVDSFLVLDHGAVLMEGEPEAVTRDMRVIEAYLGKKWAAHAQH